MVWCKINVYLSSWGRIETVDHVRKPKYVPECSDNLDTIAKNKSYKV